MQEQYTTGAYQWRNLVNGKVYVGGAYENFRTRKNHHLHHLRRNTHGNGHLQNAWNKYGEAAFVWEILERCPPDQVEEVEQKWIDAKDVLNRSKGYNIAPKAGSTLGAKLPPLSEEHKQKIREWCLQNNTTPEARARSAEASKKRWAEPDAKEEHYRMLERLWNDPEHREKVSQLFREMWQNDEYRQAMCKARLEQWQDQDFRERAIAAMREKAQTPEEKARKSAALKESWRDPEYVEKVLASRANPEVKQKRAEKFKETVSTPEFKAKVTERYTEEYCRKIGERAKARWADEEFRKAWQDKATQKFLAKYGHLAEEVTRRYLTGEAANVIAKSLGVKWNTVGRILDIAGIKKRTCKEAQALADNEDRSARLKVAWADPEFCAKQGKRISEGMARSKAKQEANDD